MGGLECGDHLGSGGEVGPVAGFGGQDVEGDGQMRLPDSRAVRAG